MHGKSNRGLSGLSGVSNPGARVMTGFSRRKKKHVVPLRHRAYSSGCVHRRDAQTAPTGVGGTAAAAATTAAVAAKSRASRDAGKTRRASRRWVATGVRQPLPQLLPVPPLPLPLPLRLRPPSLLTLPQRGREGGGKHPPILTLPPSQRGIPSPWRGVAATKGRGGVVGDAIVGSHRPPHGGHTPQSAHPGAGQKGLLRRVNSGTGTARADTGAETGK